MTAPEAGEVAAAATAATAAAGTGLDQAGNAASKVAKSEKESDQRMMTRTKLSRRHQGER